MRDREEANDREKIERKKRKKQHTGGFQENFRERSSMTSRYE